MMRMSNQQVARESDRPPEASERLAARCLPLKRAVDL